MPFDVEQFFGAPTVEALMDLRKTDLIKVAEKIDFSVRRGSFKFQIRNELIKYMVDDGLLDDSALEYVENDSDMVRIKELELQNEYRMRELEVRQRENECRMRELDIEREIKLKELELRAASPAAVPFNITANAKLVPPFQENAVDNYFRYFEKIAISSDWPKEQWTVLLQSVLTGKAQEIYMSMSVTDSRDYDKVKTAVLKGYELVPEAYRLKFRNLRKRDNQSFLDFAREKDGLLARWCESEKVDNDCDKLYQLILVEEFKKCLPDRIKMYLNENRVKVLDEAARMAEDYALIHRNVEGPKSTVKPQPTPLTGKNEFKGDKRETASPGHNSSYDKKKSVRCFNCKLLGHTISNCWFLKEKKSKDVPVALASTRFKDVKSPVEVNLLSDTDRFRNVSDEFKPFCSEGSVSLVGDESGEKPIVILRDTAALQSLLLEGVLPLAGKTSDASVVIAGIECGHLIAPLHKVHLKSHFCDKEVTVGVVPKLPIEGVSFILANDLAGEKVFAKPQINVAILSTPDINDGEQLAEEDMGMFPACAVTRTMREARRVGHDLPTVARASQCVRNKDKVCGNGNDVRGDERTSLLCHETDAGDDKLSVFPVDKGKLIDQQKCDAELCKIAELAGSETDASDIPAAYYKKGGVLMRKWRPRHVGAGDEWHVVHQVVVPAPYRSQILSLAHDSPLSGHMGINKTCRKIMNHFYWPGLRRDVVNYCKSCHQCQVVGKPNQKIPVAPLYPIPVISEPFSHVIIDCVGPLPKTKSGNNYLLTIMCSSTRYPEAIPLRKISSKAIIKELTKFFCTYGLPRVIQSDQGSNFLSKAFQAAMRRMGVRHQVSSAYHPESQGALERFHQTLKNMVRIYCHETDDQWDEMVPLLLFAARECVQDTLGFSPFELVFGHEVRGPLKMLKERWLDDDNRSDILNHVMDFRLKLHRVCELARANLGEAQRRMKTRYDRDAQSRSFSPGERVLVFLPVPGQSLKARYFGPCTVEKKLSDLNYVIQTPGKRKQSRLCHINQIKKYVERNKRPIEECKDGNAVMVNVMNVINDGEKDEDPLVDVPHSKLMNSDILNNLKNKFSHLDSSKQQQLNNLLLDFSCLFSDVPGRTNLMHHDIDIGDNGPVKQHPYRVNPTKGKQMRDEVRYMLENKIIEPSVSAWSSPCILVPKADGGIRFCTDFRKVNTLTRDDSYPIPRIDDCIDQVGKAKYVTKIDMLKGYWQIPMTERAKEISAFVTPDGLFQYCVMPFGLKTAPATFQRLINGLISGLDGCKAYLDDIIIYSDNWVEHLERLQALFERLSAANLTVNLAKSDFAHAHVTYLGYEVGQGQVKPLNSKIHAIDKYPAPKAKREVMRFLGMAGYYRRFVMNFSDIVAPLTDLLKKGVKFIWSDSCEKAFKTVKAMLISSPILISPDFEKGFILYVDASDTGAGAVLCQADAAGVDHPVCYFSKKFNKHQRNYSTVEKETLALILALRHFEIYLYPTKEAVKIYTDHNPLTFISKMSCKNQRILRWSLELQKYNLSVNHIRGKENVLADALSRG